MRKLAITFFGLGLAPFAPGTCGSLGALVIWVGVGLICRRLGAPAWAPDAAAGGLILLFGVATVAFGTWAAMTFGRNDPSQCVSDEAAGQWVALIALPAGSPAGMLVVGGVQFVLFRVFDITKPPPVRQLEAAPRGWGILLDDLAAGAYANLIGQVLFRWVWPVGA